MKGTRLFIGTALLAIGIVGSAGSASAAEEYTIDKAHSSIGFSVSHLMISKTTGSFNDYEGVVQFDAKDLANSKLDFTIKAASIDTKNEARDSHLRGGDFFGAEKYPLITFVTKTIVLKEGNNYLVTGDLTMKDVTKEVTIPITVLGPITHPISGKPTLGIEAQFTVNRQDYHVSWNKTLDNGGVMVGDDVAVTVSIEAQK